MKLKEFREIIDKIDDEASEEYEVMLDIEPAADEEYLVDIGEIFQSKMHSKQIKIEPAVELDTHKTPKRIDLEADLISRKTELRCPTCGRSVSARDRFCRKCGQPLYTRAETHDYFVEMARKRIAQERALRRERRAAKKAEKQNKES